MVQFLQNYWLTMLLILSLLIIGIILWRRGKQDFVKNAIYLLVCQAEQAFGSKTGPIKWIMVYNSLPWWIRMLFPQKILEGYIEEALDFMKDQLLNKKFNLLTYGEEVGSTTTVINNSNINGKELVNATNDQAMKAAP